VSPGTRAALGLGSNLGDRRAVLSAAISALSETPGIDVVAVSPVVETAAVGGPPQPDYLNAVAIVDTTLQPEQLLKVAQRCEQQAGRVRKERWGPRTLDVDVLAYDGVTSSDPLLTLPHPRAVERAFVMTPWAAVDPTFVVLGRSVKEWADSLDQSTVRLSGGEL
jgi:2-amino-4-hydroxy-6-hydroxymethyldihydropteridine diphosphokinase